MAKAFDILQHDLLFVTTSERALLTKAGIQPRPSWHGSDRLEEHILHSDGGPKVGVILLPSLAPGTTSVPHSLVQQMENAVQKLRSTTKLVVVMSSWGYMLEQELLKAQGPMPDILLGSGPGIGLVGTLAAEGKTAWIRSFSQGKSILRIEVLAWPDHRSTFKWTEEKNIRMNLYGLTDQYQENPQLLTLMHRMGTD